MNISAQYKTRNKAIMNSNNILLSELTFFRVMQDHIGVKIKAKKG